MIAEHTLPTIGVYHSGKACIWTTLPNGIHVFTMTESTKRTTDEWLAHLNIIFTDKSAHDEVRYIMDYRQAMPPLAYGFQRSREWLAKNPDMGNVKVAFIHKSSSMIHILNSFLQLLRAQKVTTRFFTDFDAGEQWLLS